MSTLSPVALAHRLLFIATQLGVEALDERDDEARIQLRRAGAQLVAASRTATHPSRRLEAEAFLETGITMLCRRFANRIERTIP